MREGKNKWRKCRMRRCNTDTFTQILLHTNAFTHGRFYTQRRFNISHTDALTHRRFYTHTHRRFTHRRFCTPRRLHTDYFTLTPLHTRAFTHRGFYAHRRFTHRNFYTHTQRRLQTDYFTLGDQTKSFFSSVFDGRTSFRA